MHARIAPCTACARWWQRSELCERPTTGAVASAGTVLQCAGPPAPTPTFRTCVTGTKPKPEGPVAPPGHFAHVCRTSILVTASTQEVNLFPAPARLYTALQSLRRYHLSTHPPDGQPERIYPLCLLLKSGFAVRIRFGPDITEKAEVSRHPKSR